jgi:hypothetical protein
MKTLSLVTTSLLALAPVSLGSVGTARAQYAAPVSPAAGPDYNNDGIPDGQYAQAPYEGDAATQYYAPDTTGQAVAQTGFGYFGPHPVPYDRGGGFCQHTDAHTHDFPVFDRHLFREAGGYAYFVGDPADFGYANSAYIYRGHHPLDPSHGGGFCYMDWDHRHWFAPFSVSFSFNAGAYIWGGGWDPGYYTNRAFYANYFGGYYRNSYLGGRYYIHRPAHSYIGWGWHRPIARPYGYGWGRPAYAPRPYGSPVYRAPGYATPVYHRPPVYQAPVYRAPMHQAPIYRAPMQQAPIYRAPMQQAPVYRAPMQQAPVYRAPMHQAPVYRAPMHQAPVYRAPMQQAPAFRANSFQPAPMGRFRR